MQMSRTVTFRLNKEYETMDDLEVAENQDNVELYRSLKRGVRDANELHGRFVHPSIIAPSDIRNSLKHL
jgi:hypothetical protein